MAIINFDRLGASDSSPQNDWPIPPQQTGPSYEDLFSNVNSAYKSSFNRDLRPDEAHYWIKQQPGNEPGKSVWDYAQSDWQSQIANSQEAQNYRAAQNPQPQPQSRPAAGGGDWNSFGQAWLADSGYGGTVADLRRFIAANPQYGAQLTGSKGDKVMIGGRVFDGVIGAGAGGLGKSWNDITNGEGGGQQAADTSSTYGNSASTALYQNEILARIEALRKPVNDPILPLLQSLALQRVQGLQGEPYTAGDNAALVAKYQQPLTDARDAEMQRRKEELGARNIGPTSGLYQQQLADVGSAYTKGVAGISNNLAVQAIDEKNRRAQEAIAILASLEGAGQGQRNEQNAQANELLRVASLLPGIDENRLQMLLAAGQDQAAPSSLNSLVNLAQLSQQNSQFNTGQSNQNAEAMGAYIANLIAGLGKA